MPNTYTPILRPGSNERQVIQNFGGLSNFSDSNRDTTLRPIVEIAGEDDLDRLEPFISAGEEVYVDIPEYLTRRQTKYTDALNATLRRHGSREEFFRQNRSSIPVPTVSTLVDRPVEYGIHVSMQLALKDTFNSVAHRLMIRTRRGGFTESQKSKLRELAEKSREGADVIFFDVVDVGYQEGGPLDEQLEFLQKTFDAYETGLLNVFDAMQNQPENFTPRLANQFGFDAYGDFAIDRRYPPDEGGPPPVVYLRHYYPNRGYVEQFDGEDYDDAARELVEWEDYDAQHCEFCREAERTVEDGNPANPSLWKRIRMGHYIETAVNSQI